MDMKMSNIKAVEVMPRDRCEYENEYTARWIGSVSALAVGLAGAVIVRQTGGSEGWVRGAGAMGLLGGYMGGYYGYEHWGRDCTIQKGDLNCRYGATLIECKAKGQNLMFFLGDCWRNFGVLWRS